MNFLPEGLTMGRFQFMDRDEMFRPFDRNDPTLLDVFKPYTSTPKVVLNAIVDGEVRQVSFSLEAYEKIVNAATTLKLEESQRAAARHFRYSKMMYRK